jgi:hypothetical protein
MVLTAALWCAMWILVAQVTWKVIIFHSYRLYILGGSVFFIFVGAIIMYVAVDQIGRGIRVHLRRDSVNQSPDSSPSDPNTVPSNGN